MDDVTVTYHRDGSNWWAESNALAGWSAAAGSIEHLRTLAREGVEFVTGRKATMRSAFWIGAVTPPMRVDPAGSEHFALETA
jgi:hypothetical protein